SRATARRSSAVAGQPGFTPVPGCPTSRDTLQPRHEPNGAAAGSTARGDDLEARLGHGSEFLPRGGLMAQLAMVLFAAAMLLAACAPAAPAPTAPGQAPPGLQAAAPAPAANAPTASTQTAGASPYGNAAEWERTQEAGKREGRVVVAGPGFP